jgi:hypothetical protein
MSPLREELRAELPSLEASRLVFIDESAATTKMRGSTAAPRPASGWSRSEN